MSSGRRLILSVPDIRMLTRSTVWACHPAVNPEPRLRGDRVERLVGRSPLRIDSELPVRVFDFRDTPAAQSAFLEF
jgi:hypothetical protein